MINYNSLRSLLAEAKWREADGETLRLMRKIAGKDERACLDIQSLEKFPCDDLRIIDQLWMTHSNKNYGFSKQKQIYQNLGGSLEYNENIWKIFGDTMGWRRSGKWLEYNQCRDAEFPFALFCQLHIDIEGWDILQEWSCEGRQSAMLFSTLVSRLKDCGL
ncbi:GUN4 domain-containing protein [Capilliphycus salinus ALCB114379]|uniref:GUN4 domain-containing protein n=1 Tax=Capilliphycus salinus TaxID=2768948 RepID=UPI0039A56CDC